MKQSFHLDADGVYRCSALRDIAWLEHGFGTRLAEHWLSNRDVLTVRQVHSDTVIVSSDVSRGCIGEGDALIASRTGCLAAIKTADCLPVLIVDTTQRIVAAVHAGWRGSVAGVCAKCVAVMEREYGSRGTDLVVAIGPGIGPCCFEVGPEVATQFQGAFPERADLNHRTRIDLAEVNKRSLERAGVPSQKVWIANICTCCGDGVFESFRRDREASGRMLSAIGIRA